MGKGGGVPLGVRLLQGLMAVVGAGLAGVAASDTPVDGETPVNRV